MGTDGSAFSEIPTRECWDRLRSEAYGRLAVTGPEGPMIYPVNAIVDHGAIVFRTNEGGKLDAMRADPRVAFEVDGWEPAASMAWSVLITGTAEEITRMREGSEMTELGLTPWQAGPKPTYIRIVPSTITGRTFIRTAGG